MCLGSFPLTKQFDNVVFSACPPPEQTAFCSIVAVLMTPLTNLTTLQFTQHRQPYLKTLIYRSFGSKSSHKKRIQPKH